MALTSIDFDKLVIDSIDRVTATSKTTGEILTIFEDIQNGTMTQAGERVYGQGAGGARISSLNRNKTAGFSCANGHLVVSGVGVQTGSDVEVAGESNKFIIPEIEFIEVGDVATTIVLTYVPTGATGAEIPFIYKANKDNTQGEKYAIAAEASASAFSLVPATKTITLPTGKFVKGDIVIVKYDREATVGKKISNTGNSFAKTCNLLLDVTCRDVCDNETVYHTKFVYPNFGVDNNFEIVVGDTPAVMNFGGEAMQETCGKERVYWNWFIVE